QAEGHDPVAAPGQFDGEGLAQAEGAAGDDDDAHLRLSMLCAPASCEPPLSSGRRGSGSPGPPAAPPGRSAEGATGGAIASRLAGAVSLRPSRVSQSAPFM